MIDRLSSTQPKANILKLLPSTLNATDLEYVPVAVLLGTYQVCRPRTAVNEVELNAGLIFTISVAPPKSWSVIALYSARPLIVVLSSVPISASLKAADGVNVFTSVTDVTVSALALADGI